MRIVQLDELPRILKLRRLGARSKVVNLGGIILKYVDAGYQKRYVVCGLQSQSRVFGHKCINELCFLGGMTFNGSREVYPREEYVRNVHPLVERRWEKLVIMVIGRNSRANSI